MYDNNWYKSLNKSSLTPPNYVFGIVWPILYLLMVVSVFLIIRKKGIYEPALLFFTIQLFLNLNWTSIFFNRKDIKTGLIVIIATLIFTIYTAFLFYRIDKIAGYLMIPYIIWLTFACFLNFYIYKNN